MTQSNEPGRATELRDLPTWLTVVVILLCLAGGGGLVWWYFSSPPKVVAVPISQEMRMPVRQNGGGGGNNRPPRVVEDWNGDIRPGNNGFQARSGDVQMWVRKRDGQAEPNLTVYYRNQLLPREQLNLLRVTLLANREDQAQRMKLTPEQIEALRKIPNVRGMQLSADEQKALRVTWTAYESAAADKKEEAKGAVLAMLDALGKKNLDATKTALTASVTAVRAVLTPEQQKMLESGEL